MDWGYIQGAFSKPVNENEWLLKHYGIWNLFRMIHTGIKSFQIYFSHFSEICIEETELVFPMSQVIYFWQNKKITSRGEIAVMLNK